MSDHLPVSDITPKPSLSRHFTLNWRRWLILSGIVIALFTLYHFCYIKPLNTALITQSQSITALNTRISKEAIDLHSNLNALEQKFLALEETQNAWAQSLQRYRDHDEALLADIAQTLNLATQQLQLTGNAHQAIHLLQDIEIRIRTLNKPRFNSLRQALVQDIKTLKALRNNDLVDAAQKLDQAIASIDKLPLIAPTPIITHPAPPRPSSNSSLNWLQQWQAKWITPAWEGIKEQSQQLLRIRQINEADAILATPEHAWFIRENLRLRLLNARLSLLSGNTNTLRNDFASAHTYLNRYFDLQDSTAVALQALLNKAQEEATLFALPTLQASKMALNALQNKL